MAEEAPAATAEDVETPAKNEAELARKWCAEIATAEKAQTKWVQRAKKVEKIYNDERDVSSERSRKFNILWSNVETLRPAVYMQTPKAQAVRRFRDRDPVARLASMMLERCLQTSCELYDFDNQMDQAVRDRLVPGRGQVWVFYAPEFVGEGDEAVLAYENVLVEYVPWQDFLTSVCRTWSENRWVGRRFHKSRTELKEWLAELQLDPKKAAHVKMDVSQDGDKTDEGLKDERAKCQIWEVWDKPSGQVIYVAPGSMEHAILGKKPPPVRFRDFFPCPRPLLATTTAKSLIPTPDYALYQDQAKQLDDVEARIGVLLKALSVKGVYASDTQELADLIEAGDNRMIPVKNWAMFAEGGGSKGRIEWLPIDMVAAVLKGLYEARELAKQTLYEVSGIGDIMRGATDPDETLGAQQIKERWGGKRVRKTQKDVQRFAKDIMCLKAEVIAEQFQDSSIQAMAGVDQELLAKYVPAPQMPEPPPELAQNPVAMQQMQALAKQQHEKAQADFMAQVFKLLRDDTARSFRIDVETDSTLEPDQQEEKKTAVEFMTAMATYMEVAAPMAAQGPEAAKMVGEILLFGVRRFDKVDQLEQVIEQAVEAAAKPRPPVQDPEIEIKKQEAATRDKEVEGKLMLENKRIEEVEKPQLNLKAAETKANVALQARDQNLRKGEVDQKGQIERERLDADKENNAQSHKLERRKLMAPADQADDEAREQGQPTAADALLALVKEMQRPVKIVRGEDGMAVGLE